mmetsp:Transcript_20579/g.44689  ORF Transcript_20579/g.44689 Transcript_20579/m.44689 type:complete len:199 (-) Transcript_20579:130-726(-)|eukprot:CAMPEP_0172310478 /NCGR_PEP_ID=MMETSP1058-20130122/11506_1 /TAXON_ID=83371 /ORGANISM="Detonula confervacea, Strain CCMP 353" /LENGTH=198 /DNA_ID=CAMNT_0013023285 /DNA_START=80 /DNA_END=676 /DNA_ORIENTATION=+
MFASSLILLALAPMMDVEAFSPQTHHAVPICSRMSQYSLQSQMNARGDGFGDDGDDNDEDDSDFVYAGRRSGRRGKEEGGYYGDQQSSSGSSKQYQDNVEFFDLEDDDLLEDDYKKGGSDDYSSTYNGIIPNPLLDAMDPDGVYERLGPELFKDWTFFRDMALFAAFLTFFTRDTHHYGTFDSVIEGLERLPKDFIHS